MVPASRNWVTHSVEETKVKGYKRRTIFDGWNNFTEFEKEWIEKVKDELLSKYGINLAGYKAFGPRVPNGIFKKGSN